MLFVNILSQFASENIATWVSFVVTLFIYFSKNIKVPIINVRPWHSFIVLQIYDIKF